MKSLRHKQQVPYGGEFSINRPDLEMVGSGNRWYNLVENVKKWRKANSIKIGLGFEDELMQVVCDKYPDECIEFDPSLPPTKVPRLTLANVIAGTRIMLSFIASGRQVVSQQEASRRADICATCPYNVHFPNSCDGHCGPLKDLVLGIVGSRNTPRKDELKSCQVCSCFLQAAVWLPLEIQLASLSANQRSQFSHIDWCWKKP